LFSKIGTAIPVKSNLQNKNVESKIFMSSVQSAANKQLISCRKLKKG